MPKTITFWKTWLDNYPLQEYPDAFSRFSTPTKNSFESSLNENLSIVLFANRCELRDEESAVNKENKEEDKASESRGAERRENSIGSKE